MTQTSSPTPLPESFDARRELYARSPEEYEARRQATIAQALDEMDAGRRLRGMQWRIDMERRRIKNELAAATWLYDRMWAHFAGPEGLNERMQDLAASLRGT